MNVLEGQIRQEIRAGGPLRFDRFMELALYHPQHGYYAAPRPLGRTGDFLTSVSVGPLFGQLLARQARQMAALLDEPAFWILEQGAHDGQLAHDILTEAAADAAFFARLRYLLVEPSAAMQAAQRRRLVQFIPTVTWTDSIASWPGDKPAGLFLSNELADALPVRLIEARDGIWLERCVGLAESSLAWTLTAVDKDLRDAIETLPLVPADGYRTEIGLAARGWMTTAAAFLRRGYVLTIDYGFPAALYYAPFRREGTLTCYRDHQRGDEVLAEPGGQDITAHVDFTALARAGEQAGLETLGLVDQSRFLTGILQGNVARFEQRLNGGEGVKAWNMLTHPGHLGARFYAMVQGRDAPANLDGLTFAHGRGIG